MNRALSSIALFLLASSSAAEPAKPTAPKPGPVAALAYRSDGKLLAAGGYKEVVLLSMPEGKVAGRIGDLAGPVTALAFDKEGGKLAVGVSVPGKSGELRTYSNAALSGKPLWTVKAHKDAIHQVTFSPDGKTVATVSYDRLVKLWSAADGAALHSLTDHSDAVYGVAFSPDGKLLATAAADRTVKVWRVADGGRLYTLGEPTDWLYAVAWSPDGSRIAAAGVDKRVRVWTVTEEAGKLDNSNFVHDGPVLKLAYSADGKTIYTLGEDRALKSWDALKLTEIRVFDHQPETALSLAVSPDGRHAAVGRFDGTAALYDTATGKQTADLLPAKPAKPVKPPEPPTLTRIVPNGAAATWATTVTFEGKNLAGVAEIVGLPAGVPSRFAAAADKVTVTLTIPGGTKPGVYKVGLKSPVGATATLPFAIDPFPAIEEKEPNDSRSAAQVLTLPATVAGGIGRDGDTDFYAFDAGAGTELGVQILAGELGGKMKPVLALLDEEGRVLAESSAGTLGRTLPAAGRYVLRVRDGEYKGGADYGYRLSAGPLPVVTNVFPLGLRRGTHAEVAVTGANLGGVKSVRVAAPADAAVGSKVEVAVTLPDGRVVKGPSLVVGEFAEATPDRAQDTPQTAVALPVPGTANGRIGQPGESNHYWFSARKGRPLIVEVEAARLGSPLDSIIEILDTAGKPVPRAVLRCLAQTATTFRDNDSVGAGIRLENWADLGTDDFVMIGNELVRIRALPRGPDDDMQCVTHKGRRLGYLDTTPTQHALGEPVYKVGIFPPGTTFPPNGMPVFVIHYRNDDSQAGGGRDSRLTFEPPADGEYVVRISDVRGSGGPDHAYRLTVREPRPDFTVSASPMNPTVTRGGAVPINIDLDRRDNFGGPVTITVENLPAGFSAPPTNLSVGENSTSFALAAAADAAAPAKGAAPIKIVAKAKIGGAEVVREAVLGLPAPVDPGDIVTTTAKADIAVVPGKSVWLKVNVERRNKFAGRIPIEVKGLPHGVRVLDIGLNGILITEKETSREIEIYAEPWAQPTSHPFVVFAKREGKADEYAAPSVMLRVTPPAKGK